MKDQSQFHLQEPHDQLFVAVTKRKTSGKRRGGTHVHIHLHEQETNIGSITSLKERVTLIKQSKVTSLPRHPNASSTQEMHTFSLIGVVRIRKKKSLRCLYYNNCAYRKKGNWNFKISKGDFKC